jgi:hypothetical protein
MRFYRRCWCRCWCCPCIFFSDAIVLFLFLRKGVGLEEVGAAATAKAVGLLSRDANVRIKTLARTHAQTHILTHSLSLSLTHTHTHTHKHTHTDTPTQTHTHT